MNSAKWILAAVVATAPIVSASAAAGDGLTPNVDNIPWVRWQGRLSLGSQAPAWRSNLGQFESSGLKVHGVSLMGDYYFKRTSLDAANTGGFRATGGVILGQRSLLWATPPAVLAPGAVFGVDRRMLWSATSSSAYEPAGDLGSLPYVGVGYTGLSLRGGWSLSADLGRVAMSPASAIRLGRVVGGTQSLDDLLRDMRLAPVVQLGVSYSF